MMIFDENLNILNLNNSVSEYIGKSKEEIVNLGSGFLKESLFDGDCIGCIIKKTFQDGNERKIEIKNQDDKIYEINTFPLRDDKGEILKVLVSIKDVTENKINESNLLQTSKMVAVGQLAAGVAHEIRNPLGLIKNYTYILKKEINKLQIENGRIHKSIYNIENSVQGASQIIANLLNFSRISNRENKEVDINEFAKNIIQLEKKTLEKQGISLIVDIEEKTYCNINEEALKHILINLISNSIDAMPNGGNLKIKGYKEGIKVYISIEDTGIEISDKDLSNIYNPFYTTKLPNKGTGLGLYIVYNEIQKLGGNISVKSKLREGTKFSIILPDQL
ncbi:ATP-binding protein [Anaerosalibacter bizertensis]|nr:ATP-binding protein [Anaerosalibacter bizertensis]